MCISYSLSFSRRLSCSSASTCIHLISLFSARSFAFLSNISNVADKAGIVIGIKISVDEWFNSNYCLPFVFVTGITVLEEDGVLLVDAVVMGIAGTVVATIIATVVESDIVSNRLGF